MNRQSYPAITRALGVAFLFATGSTTGACWSSDPCEPGQTLRFDSCFPAAPAKGAAGATGGPADGSASEAGAAAPASFGKVCTSATDCEAGSPICGAPQLPYCTQIDCQDGEANAGACPTGFQCIKVGANPSVCLRS